MTQKFFLIFFFLMAFCIFCSHKGEQEKTELSRLSIDLSTLQAKFPFKGRIVFQSNLDGDHEIYLLTAANLLKLTDNPWEDEYPKWSPDGTKIAFTANPSGKYQIFIMDADGSHTVQITHSKNDAIEHAWFPDGKKIAFTEEVKRGFGRHYTLWMMDLESKKTEKIIPEFSDSNALPDFSPTDPLMAFTGKRTMGWDVFVYNLKTRKYVSLTEGGGACRPHFSKDGKKIAYVSAEADGKGDIWVMNPDGSDKIRVTERNDTYDYFPAWSPDGKHIVFCSGLKHYPTEGRWALYLVIVRTKTIIPLFKSSARDLFPDWY